MCDHVWKKIRGVEVLRDISFTMESGTIYGLWGKNGCGKTMLMRLLSGLIKPTSGSVFIDGRQLGKDFSYPESIGVMIENPAFLREYSGLENLRILASIRGIISDQEIQRCITSVGLDPDDTRKYRKYSLGMKQRLGIACAVMEHPDIVILDEPINALDESGVKCVRDILSTCKRDGQLVVLACHDRDEMKQLADEIFIMEEGKVTRIEPASSF